MVKRRNNRWQELGQEFHMAIGQCIAAWARVDDELFGIFRDCVGPYEQSAIIYYRTPGLDVRFALTDEIVRSVLPKRPKRSGAHEHPSVKAWDAARDGYQELLATRRRIAHHPVGIRSEPFRVGMPIGVEPPSWFEIYVSQHERLREKSSDLPPLNVSDLKSHLAAVVALQARLHRFFHEVLTKRAGESSTPSPSKSLG